MDVETILWTALFYRTNTGCHSIDEPILVATGRTGLSELSHAEDRVQTGLPKCLSQQASVAGTCPGATVWTDLPAPGLGSALQAKP